MLFFAIAAALCILVIICQTAAQQFSGVLPLDDLGFSDGCLDAVNTTVTCPDFLLNITDFLPRLGPGELSALCTPECQSSLIDVRGSVAQNCTGANDTVEINGDQVPATYMSDLFLYTYALACRKDNASGEYCDLRPFEYANETLAAEHACSDCSLGQRQIQVNLAPDNDEDWESQFNSMTSSCSASNYPWTSHGPYGQSSTSTVTTSPMSSTTATALGSGAASSTAQSSSASGDAASGATAISCATFTAFGGLTVLLYVLAC